MLIYVHYDGSHADGELILTDTAVSANYETDVLVYDNDLTTVRELRSPAGQEFLRSLNSKYVMVTVSLE